MAEQEYPNTGAMFARDKKSEKAADMGGDFTLDGDVLDYVLRCAERGEPVKLEIAGWKRRTRTGGQMLSLQVQMPYEERGGGPRQNNYNRGAQQPQRGGYGLTRGGGGRSQRDSYDRDQDVRNEGQRAAPRYDGQGTQSRPGYREMRRDMDDEIPFGGEPRNERRNKWD